MTVALKVAVDSCYDPPLKRTLDRLARNNNEVLAPMAVLIDASEPATYINNNMLSYFVNQGEDAGGGGVLAARRLPPPKIQLLEDMSVNGTFAEAKIIEWSSGAYNVVGTAADVHDIFGKWEHSRSGDRGYLGYDEERELLFLYDMNTPLIRIGILNSGDDIANTPTGTIGVGTVVSSGLDFEVHGFNVLDLKKIPKAATTYVTFYYDFAENKYIAISTNKCLT